MRIAVASQNFRTVTSHVGRTRRFFLFEAEPGAPVREVGRLDLPKGMALHDYKGDGPHPLYEVDAVIAASVGEGFARRMSMRGIAAAATSEPDPVAAAQAFVEGRLPPGAPHEHDHTHGHDHGDGCDHG
ncbi:NifB/NifX family molybdenum-iron cluster-binding protein [Phaeovulum vinaykumarii]|uniref:Predicted Fe-Mo cluster-binding protein, NifX family n=1 Tax=Phaeovulum vinaykumarii TaxID=407234 RepID=A0A1N7K049_9RHOB|nr:NifB/NifX family molybdenum-iron cluster-binding protein [Phaeovulum vinaykumarii]SIS54947.1 Predicted Fe-Mo cluster-binding protein, NifX family [Phaeovulum vinaykumarii]SOB92151.1 predicted Fe-Mo cluster-binding NifX family protein [Phaeovulum vinaykumarii]